MDDLVNTIEDLVATIEINVNFNRESIMFESKFTLKRRFKSLALVINVPICPFKYVRRLIVLNHYSSHYFYTSVKSI